MPHYGCVGKLLRMGIPITHIYIGLMRDIQVEDVISILMVLYLVGLILEKVVLKEVG